jgi:hypothetical protein
MCSLICPLHLLLFHHPFCNNFIYRRFNKCRGNSFTIAPLLTKVGNQMAIIFNIEPKLVTGGIMSTIIASPNKSYFDTISIDIKTICKPLERFGITYFAYGKIFDDNTGSAVVTDGDSLYHHWKQNYPFCLPMPKIYIVSGRKPTMPLYL